MTTLAFDIMTVTTSAAVADGGTLTFTYPASRAAASYSATGAFLFADGHGTLYAQTTGGFSVSYGATTATVTYDGSTSIPAGTEVSLQAPLVRYAAKGTTIVSLTDSSGGTAADTIADVPASYTEATLANQLASLTRKMNEVIAVLRGASIAN